MNKSMSFQPVGGIVFYGIPPRRFPALLTVWGGQMEREAAFLNVKLHAARFRVCVSLLADRRITAAVCKQTLFQGGVVGADMDMGAFSSNRISAGFSRLVSPVLMQAPFCAPVTE